MTVPRTVFADASYFIALRSQPDRDTKRAAAWNQYPVRNRTNVVTTEAVLWEFLNFFASRGREVAFQAYSRLHADQQIRVVPFNDAPGEAAVRLYSSRDDQEWGVIDCLSFEVMWSRDITAALTFDRHFIQAGFVSLLDEEPPGP
jgi:predicted nucleic acid-binding protein